MPNGLQRSVAIGSRKVFVFLMGIKSIQSYNYLDVKDYYHSKENYGLKNVTHFDGNSVPYFKSQVYRFTVNKHIYRRNIILKVSSLTVLILFACKI